MTQAAAAGTLAEAGFFDGESNVTTATSAPFAKPPPALLGMTAGPFAPEEASRSSVGLEIQIY